MEDTERGRSSGRVSEIAVEVTDRQVPCVAATTDLGGRFRLEQFLPRADGSYAEYYGVEGLDPDRLLEYAEAHDESDARFLYRADDRGLLEMIVTGDCPAQALADTGAVPRAVDAVRGELRIVAEVPPQYDGDDVAARFLEDYPDAELLDRREQSSFAPVVPRRRHRSFRERITDRQLEVVDLAERRGYYAWPRQVTREELAAELGMDAATVRRHLRAAERALARVAFDDTRAGRTASGAAQKT
jgi:predicted DNA binding protein